MTIGLSIAVLYTLGFALGLVKSIPLAYAITVIQDVSYGKVAADILLSMDSTTALTSAFHIVIYPAINSLKSQLSASNEQGQVLGSVTALQKLADGKTACTADRLVRKDVWHRLLT